MPEALNAPSGLIYAVLPRATIGLVVAGGRVVMSPPYACASGWKPGRDAQQVWRELARRVDRHLPEGHRLLWLADRKPVA